MSAESVLGKLQGHEVEQRRQRAAEALERAREADDALIRERSAAVRALAREMVEAHRSHVRIQGRWMTAVDRLISAKAAKKRNAAKRKRIAAGKIIAVVSPDGIEYRSVRNAACCHRVSETTIRNWVDTGTWKVVR